MDVVDAAELGVTVVDHVAELVVVLDQSGTIRYTNRRAEVLLGLSRDDWIGRAAFDLIHPDDLPLALELLVSSQATGVGVKEPVQYRLRRADDTWLSVEIVACPFELDSGSTAIVITGRETSARRGPDAIVSEVAARLSRMFDDAACGMTQTSLSGELLRVNRSFATMLGYRPDELVGRSFSSLSHQEDRHNDIIGFRGLCEGAVDMYRSSKRYLSRSGEIVHAELTASMVFDRRGQPLYCASQTIDVSELRALQTELTYRSTHDALTGLANRTFFETLLDQALSRAARSHSAVGVLFVDLDGFKAVNDKFGHTVGDQVLARVADRLGGAVRNGDVVARFGGDEFVLLTENTSVAAAVATAHRLVHEVSAPYCIDGTAVDLGVSVGVAVEPAGQVGAATLVAHADCALYRAKRNGRGQVAVHGQPHTTHQAKQTSQTFASEHAKTSFNAAVRLG